MKTASFRVLNLLVITAMLFGFAAFARPARGAMPTELFFSEYIEGSSNNKALEIYNGTGAAVDLGAGSYSIQMFFNGSATAGLTINLTGTVAAGDVYVVAHSSANTTILTQADQTNGAGWFNGDDAVTLRKGSTVIDAIGQIGFDPGSQWGAGLTSTGDNTLRRQATICAGDPDATNAFDPAAEWDGYAQDTADGLGAHTASCGPRTPVINEFSASTTGTDVEFVEIYGDPSTDYSAYTVLEIEGDSGASAGMVDGVIAVGATGAGGLQLISLPANALENGSITLLLVQGFTGALNSDLDSDNNGVFDSTPWTAIVDAVAINDGGASDLAYGVPVLGVSYDGAPFAPGGASRIPDGVDTDTAADWVRNDYDLAGIPDITGTPVYGEAYNTPGAPNQAVPAGDSAPGVASSNPANGATEVGRTTDVTVTFSEPVNLSGNWFQIACATSGTRVVADTAVSGGPTVFVINPNMDFAFTETCTLTVYAASVTDQDTDDPPDVMEADYSATFTTAADVCAMTYTPAYAIQGSGLSAAITGAVTTQGVVIGDYEVPTGSGQIRGFFIQDLTGDGDPATSDGIFVYNGNNNNVNLGDVVRVTGNASDYQNQTQVSASGIVNCGAGTVSPADVTLPVPSADYLERYEGMLVRLPQTLYVTEHYQLGRFGQVVVSSGARLQQPTNVEAPGAPALALQAANNLNRLIIDDGTNVQNPDPIVFGRGGLPLSASNTLRGGDTATGIVGVLNYTWGGNAASPNAYRVRPVNALGGTVSFAAANPRPAAPPAPAAGLRVAGMNQLNYFNTFGDGNCTNGVGGTAADCRGADDLFEYDRQWPKTAAAIIGTGADIIGAVELENDGYGFDSAIQDLVNKLNLTAGPGTYAFIDADARTGQVNALGVDAIKVGFLYKPAKVAPVGRTAALNTVAFVNGGDSGIRNRPALAQAFEEVATGATFVVAVNHLKSKGSACDTPDAGDGQGQCNIVRVNAAHELTAWLASDPTETGDADALIIGDLNSYAMEDPITAILTAGYTNLVRDFQGGDAYSYVFDGQWGYLDHALANASMASQVSAVHDWHINADEPSVLDYNDDYKSAGQIASLYAPDEFRMSDHDAVLVDIGPINTEDVVGWVFFDTNEDGWRQDSEQPGLAGVYLTLEQGGQIVAQTKSVGDNGWYIFEEIASGDYCLSAAIPPGFVATSPATVCFTVGMEQRVTNFGVVPARASIGDTVFHDADLDGIQDAGEPGIPNVTVALWTAVSGAPDAVVGNATTDANGHYLFGPIAPGEYFVQVTDAAGELAGLTLTTPGNPLGPITVVHKQDYLAADFGYGLICASSRGAIAGRVWHDLNADGVQDAGEAGIKGVPVCAEPLGYVSTYCRTTNTQGWFYMCVPKHTYLVAPDWGSAALAGLAATTREFYLSVVIQPGGSFLGAFFGYR